MRWVLGFRDFSSKKGFIRFEDNSVLVLVRVVSVFLRVYIRSRFSGFRFWLF